MPTLDENVTTLIQGLVDRASDLLPDANAQELALLGHAISATRGTATMQAIIELANETLSDLDTAKDTHLAALVTAANTHLAALEASLTTMTSQLTTVRDSSITQIQNVWLSVAGLRIGDIAWRLFPNDNALPAVMLPLVGGTVVAADYPNLVTAWGLNGGTVSDFVTNYNATNPHSITVRVEGGTLYLPKMDRMFPIGGILADMGKYDPDAIRTHVHEAPVAGGRYVYGNTTSGNTDSGTNGTVKITNPNTGGVKASGTSSVNVGPRTKPESLSGVFFVRAL